MGSPSLEQLCLPSVFSDLTTMRALILTLTLILLSLLLSVQAKRSSLYEDKPFDKNNPRMSTENCNIRGQEDDLSCRADGATRDKLVILATDLVGLGIVLAVYRAVSS